MKMTNSFNFLKFVWFKDLDFSDISVRKREVVSLSYKKDLELVLLSNVLTQSKEKAIIVDEQEYKRITVKSSSQGVVLRDIAKGETIKTKNQYVARKGQLIMSKFDAKNGAIGIVPDELDGAIVTNDFPLFDISEKINPLFLLRVVSSKLFTAELTNDYQGFIGMARLNVDKFLNKPIPMLPLKKQARLSSLFESKISEALLLEEKISDNKREIQLYLCDKLGFVKSKETESKNNGLLQFVKWKELENWNVKVKIDNNELISSYPIQSLGDVCYFRPRHNTKVNTSFKYIELGSIDAVLGVVSAKNIELDNIPQRATQIVVEGDLIIGLTRPNLKKFAVITQMYSNCICSSGFQVIAPSEKYNSEFICEVLKTDFVLNQISSLMKGLIYPTINTQSLKKVKIPFPPVQVQNEIAYNVSKLKQDIVDCKSRISELRQQALEEFENEIFE